MISRVLRSPDEATGSHAQLNAPLSADEVAERERRMRNLLLDAATNGQQQRAENKNKPWGKEFIAEMAKVAKDNGHSRQTLDQAIRDAASTYMPIGSVSDVDAAELAGIKEKLGQAGIMPGQTDYDFQVLTRVGANREKIAEYRQVAEQLIGLLPESLDFGKTKMNLPTVDGGQAKKPAAQDVSDERLAANATKLRLLDHLIGHTFAIRTPANTEGEYLAEGRDYPAAFNGRLELLRGGKKERGVVVASFKKAVDPNHRDRLERYRVFGEIPADTKQANSAKVEDMAAKAIPESQERIRKATHLRLANQPYIEAAAKVVDEIIRELPPDEKMEKPGSPAA